MYNMSGATITRAIKYSLVGLNALIFISGLVMLIAGSIVQGQINSQNLARTIGGYSLSAGSIICIIFGILVLIVSVFGMYSTIKDQHRFLILYGSFMTIVFLFQFITGVVGLSVRNSSKFNDYVSDTFKSEFVLNSTQPEERDVYQQRFKCCGWQSPKDYLNGI
jgi:hypothetical protein